MGGNVEFHNIVANPIDVRSWGRDKCKGVVTNIIEHLGLCGEIHFSGSTDHLFDPTIEDDVLVKYKPTFGDIDVLVPNDLKDSVESILKEDCDNLIGWKKSGQQFITLWNTEIGDIQVDLCFVDYTYGFPDPWALFSHSSSREDLIQGIRGVYHKMFLRALTSMFVCEVDESGTTDNTLAFSVQHGIRDKYENLGNGNFKKLKPSESKYETDLEEIFAILFGDYPPEDDVLDYMWSVKGLIHLLLCSYRNVPVVIDCVMNGFFNILLGKNCQKFQKNEVADRLEKEFVIREVAKMLYDGRIPTWLEVKLNES